MLKCCNKIQLGDKFIITYRTAQAKCSIIGKKYIKNENENVILFKCDKEIWKKYCLFSYDWNTLFPTIESMQGWDILRKERFNDASLFLMANGVIDRSPFSLKKENKIDFWERLIGRFL